MTAAGILNGIRRLRVLVIGDICLDRWCQYDPATAEASRETGIPRIGVVATEVTPGAAGTVANNLVSLGARDVAVLGVIGDDGFGFELQRALRVRGIRPDLAIVSADIPTFTYTKLINRHTGVEDLPRVDFINTRPLPKALDLSLVEQLERVWPDFDVILVSDQAETVTGGAIGATVRTRLGSLAADTPEKVVWVDSRVRAELFRNVLVKCNDGESDGACLRSGLDPEQLRNRIGSRPLIVTRGGEGAIVIDDAGRHKVPTRHVPDPVDICGAGDSFSAGAALALAITGSPVEAVRFGNMVSSITIMKKGTGTASPQEVLQTESDWP